MNIGIEMIGILQLTFTKRQVSHQCSPDCDYKKRWKFHASSRQRSSILLLSACHKIRVDHLHQFNNALSNRKRPFCIENGILIRLTAVSPDPFKLLKQLKYVGLQVNTFSMSSVVSVRKTFLEHLLRLLHNYSQGSAF